MSDTLLDELSAIKDVEDTVVGNKVANFAYDDYAYEHNDANGVDTYNVNNHQNIPNGTASIMKVNSTILTKGWRAQASAITRMAMNHFLGRISYNLNKLNDLFSLFLTKLMAYMEQPNGLATLNSEGKVTALNNVANTSDSDSPVKDGVTKFTTGGMHSFISTMADVFTEGTSKQYVAGRLYYYDGNFYMCRESVTLSSWDASYFQAKKPLYQVSQGGAIIKEVNLTTDYVAYTYAGIYLFKNDTSATCNVKRKVVTSGREQGYLFKGSTFFYVDVSTSGSGAEVTMFNLQQGEKAIYIKPDIIPLVYTQN